MHLLCVPVRLGTNSIVVIIGGHCATVVVEVGLIFLSRGFPITIVLVGLFVDFVLWRHRQIHHRLKIQPLAWTNFELVAKAKDWNDT